MLYVYRRASSLGARELVNGLMDAGTPAKRWSDRFPRTLRHGDKIVGWGEASPGTGPQGIVVPCLNPGAIQTKFQDALKLKEAGVPTVEVSQALPALQVVNPTVEVRGGQYDRGNAQRLLEGLQSFLALPIPTPAIWLARRNNHIGGADLLHPGRADYYSKKESIDEEYRIHMFRGKSIRAGKKVRREGFEQSAHEWIRSFDGGWRIQYDGFESSKQLRELSSNAVSALGLDFAAVDLGRTTDGRLIVLECNRAPGLEGGTVVAYVQAIQRWLAGATE